MPTLTSILDAVCILEVPKNAVKLRYELSSALSLWIGMLLNCSSTLFTLGGRKFTTETANEYVIVAYLSPSYCAAMQSVYGYSEKEIVLSWKGSFNCI